MEPSMVMDRALDQFCQILPKIDIPTSSNSADKLIDGTVRPGHIAIRIDKIMLILLWEKNTWQAFQIGEDFMLGRAPHWELPVSWPLQHFWVSMNQTQRDDLRIPVGLWIKTLRDHLAFKILKAKDQEIVDLATSFIVQDDIA